MKDQETMLKLMRFWLFGTFVIIYAAATVYLGGAIGIGIAIMGELDYWIAMIAAAALCVVWYFIYKWYLGRQA